MSKKLDDEQQKMLLNFLLNILKDTKSIKVKCDCSHRDLYYELVDNFNELNIMSIKEDWNVDNHSEWKVKIDFLYPLRSLLDIRWKND